MNQTKQPGGSRRSGHAVVETALIAPWIFFLFVGVLDFGFYAYALISVQNAARVAALGGATSVGAASDTQQACLYVREELQRMPNINGQALSCTSSPLWVAAQQVTGPDGRPAAQVAVRYETIPLIPIPGLLTGKMTVTRVAESRIFGG
jgi:hypothetical protein